MLFANQELSATQNKRMITRKELSFRVVLGDVMIDIIYEDSAVIVCRKPAGVLSQSGGEKESGMPELLSLQCGCSVYPVHRLDRGVGGVMVFAKTQKAAASLNAQIAEKSFEKEYYAAVWGIPEEESAVLSDLLFKDSGKNKSFVVKRMRKGVREARLFYQTVSVGEVDEKAAAAVRVKLYTGRSHQIRVQFASRKHPLLGDGRYGAKDGAGDIALFSCRVAFTNPTTGERQEFSARPKESSVLGRLLAEGLGGNNKK